MACARAASFAYGSLQLDCPPERKIGHYSSSQSILLVGEGDFSFSNCLANAFGNGRNITATSFDTQDEVVKKYAHAAASNLFNLDNLGALLIHKVDATCMAAQAIIRSMVFDRIVYNFPHAGFHGREDDKHMIKMHKRLVRLFFENSVKLLQHDGEVHVSHKATAPYTKWKLEKQAAKGGLTVKVICDFQQGEYPGYINRRGDGNDSASSFHLGPCKTFIFKKHPGIFSPWNQLSNMLSAPLSILGLKHRAFSMPVQERFASCINGVQRICHKRRRDDENDCISALCQATDGVHALKRRSLGVLHTMNRTALPPTTSMVLNIPPRGRNKMSFTSGSFSPLVDPRRAVMSLRNSLLPGMSMVRQRHPLPFLL